MTVLNAANVLIVLVHVDVALYSESCTHLEDSDLLYSISSFSRGFPRAQKHMIPPTRNVYVDYDRMLMTNME